MPKEKFILIDARYCFKKRTQTFNEGTIVLATASCFDDEIFMIHCDKTKIKFNDGYLYGYLTNVGEFYLRRKQEYTPTDSERASARLLGRPNPEEQHRIWKEIGNGFPHVKLKNLTLRTGIFNPDVSYGGIDSREANFLFNFSGQQGFTGSSIKIVNTDEEVSINYPIHTPSIGAWGDKDAAPYTLKYVLKKLRGQIIARETEYTDENLEIITKKELEKINQFLLKELQTQEHSKEAQEYGPVADQMAGLG